MYTKLSPASIKGIVVNPLKQAKYKASASGLFPTDLSEPPPLKGNIKDISEISGANVALDVAYESEDDNVVIYDNEESSDDIDESICVFDGGEGNVDWTSFKHYREFEENSEEPKLEVVDNGPTYISAAKKKKQDRLRREFWDKDALKIAGISKPDNTVWYATTLLNKNGTRKKTWKDKRRCEICGSVFQRSHLTQHNRSIKHRQAARCVENQIQTQIVAKGKKFFLIPDEHTMEEYLVQKVKEQLTKEGYKIVKFK